MQMVMVGMEDELPQPVNGTGSGKSTPDDP
jgi:hypothetical protein